MSRLQALIKGLHDHYKRSASKSDREWSISKAQFKTLILSNCHYCGIEPRQKRHNNKILYNGIDRLDNTKGYIEGNCVACCGTCNWMKGKLSVGDFLSKINRISQIHQPTNSSTMQNNT
jgi:hypothetical protein